MSCSSYPTYSRKWVSEPERPSNAGAISARRGLSLGRADRVRVHGPAHALVDLGHGALKLLAEPEPSSSRHCARCAAHRREGNRLARAVLRDAGWSYDAGLNDGESYSALVSARVRGSGGSRHFGQRAPVDCKGCPSARVTLAGLNAVFAAADCRSRDGDGRPPGSTHGSTGYS